MLRDKGGEGLKMPEKEKWEREMYIKYHSGS